jgi:hypothetical protein
MHYRNSGAGAFILLFVFYSIAGVFLSAAKASEVGKAGDLSAAQIEGCKIIPQAVVRRALQRDPQIQTAISPSASLEDLRATVEQCLLAGYLEQGFAHAAVATTIASPADHLIIRVIEGKQYKAGDVIVDGAKLADATALASVLTQPSEVQIVPAQIDAIVGTIVLPTWTDPEKAQGALWRSGRPAALIDRYIEHCRRKALEGLYSQGFCWADVKIEPRLNDDGTVDLVVHILHEGLRAVLGDVQVNGLTLNQPKDVLRFVGLEPGMPINLEILREAHKKLWDSGRFLKQTISAQAPASDPGQLKLVLDLREHPEAPPLNKPLETNPVQAAMVRAAVSLQKSLASGSTDMLMTMDSGRDQFSIIAAANQGVVMTWNRRQLNELPATNPSAPAPIALIDFLDNVPEPADLTMVMLKDRFALLSAAAARQYTVAAPFPVVLKLACVPNGDDALHPLSLTVNAGFDTDSDPGGVDFQCAVAPVALLNLATPWRESPETPRPTSQIQDGILTISNSQMTLRIEQASGRIVDSTFIGPMGTIHLRTQNGAVQREEAKAAAAAFVNDYDPRHPFSSAAAFLLAWNAKSPLGVPMGMQLETIARPAAILKLVAASALAPLDERILSDQTNKDDPYFFLPDFSIGDYPVVMFFRSFNGDQGFPYGSWPWTIIHEGLMSRIGHAERNMPELIRVLNGGEIGPVGYMSMSAAIRLVNPNVAPSVARMGLDHLTADDFKKDFRVLIASQSIGSKVLRIALQNIADLNDADFATLIAPMSEDASQAFRYVRDIARQNPGRAVADVLADAPDQWWDKSLRKIVDAELRRQAN